MKRHAFTLVELLVVIAIIGLLSTVAVVATSSARAKSRDLKRKADLKQLASAVELFYAKYDRYPDTSGNWWTTCRNGGGWAGLKGVSGANGWIPDLAPEFIGQLPLDPVRGTGVGALTNPVATSDVVDCYVYRSDGVNYKIASHCSAESGPAGSSDPFYKGSAVWSCGDYHFAVYTPGAYGW